MRGSLECLYLRVCVCLCVSQSGASTGVWLSARMEVRLWVEVDEEG